MAKSKSAPAEPRTLKPLDDDTAHTPFPYDANALSNIRSDQKPRFFGVLTDPDKLEDKTLPIDSMVAMQNRIDPEKAEAMRGGKIDGKPPVVVHMNGRNYIADGHHRATAAWLDGETDIPVKYKDLDPVDNALKGAIAGTIIKADEDQHMVYGWASVISKAGKPVVDKQGDVIDADDLVKATTDFMMDVRKALAMHERNTDGGIDEDMVKGVVVHSFPLTAELAKSLGIETDQEGWIVGIKVNDPDTWAAVKSGVLKAFSIGGHGIRQEIA